MGVILIASVIFFSSVFLTETIGSCEFDKDCFAINATTRNATGPFDMNNCYNYLRDDFLIQCYSFPNFDYIASIGKAGSVIAFGTVFLGFEIALFVGSMHLGSQSRKSLILANVLFWSVGIALLFFYLFSLVGILIYEPKRNSINTKAYSWEIYLGYLVILTVTLPIPMFFTSIIFFLFTNTYYKLF